MEPHQIKISSEYLQRENIRENYVHDWVKSYCKRNKIKIEIKNILHHSSGPEESEPYLVLEFKSGNQRNWFVKKGNQKFPYFEFI